MLLSPFRMMHLSSAEFNAVLVLLAMTCCGLCFVFPSAGSWYEIGVFLVMWVLAQRALACGAKYQKGSAVGILRGSKVRTRPMKDTVVLMTGGERGFGFQAAMELAGPLGATLYLACNSKNEGTQAMGRILSKHPDATVHLLPEFDLTDFASIQRLVAAFRKQEKVLHVLINNAGVMSRTHKWTNEQKIPGVAATAGGSSSSSGFAKFELHTAVNFLGPMLLTELLIPQLILGTKDAALKVDDGAASAKSGNAGEIAFTCRIINTASSSHLMVPFKDTSLRAVSKKATETGGGAGDASPEKGRSLPVQRLRYLNETQKSPLGFKAPDFFKRYGTVGVYGLSKLAVLYSTNEQSKFLRERCGHRAVSLSHHPGLCCSNLFDGMLPKFLGSSGVLFPVTKLMSLIVMKTQWEAAQTILHCATIAPAAHGARYKHFQGGTTLSANAYVVDCKDYGKGTGVTSLSEMAQEDAASQQVVAWGMEQVKPWIDTMQDHID